MAEDKKTRYLLKTKVNGFHYLYQDAEYLMSAARLPNIKGTFEEVRITRSAMLLYIISLEGLINRALDNFLQQPIHDFIIDREEKFSTAEPGRAKRWREAPDSWVGTQRRAIVASPSRRAVGAKKAPRDRRHLAQGLCQVFTEDRGTTF